MTTEPLPRMGRVRIGDVTVHALVDAAGPTRPPGDLLLGYEAGMETPHDWLVPDYLAPDGRLVMAYQSFLIRTGGRAILVDCAVGEDGEFPARPDWHRRKSNWLAHLGQAGLTPDEVDTVFLTHLHPDHTGWLTRLDAGTWTPTFPAARHAASRTEIEYWTAHHAEVPVMGASWTDSVAPVIEAGLMGEAAVGDALAEDLIVVDLAGHSPGMIGLELRRDGHPVAAFNADLMHHPLQMARPELSTVFCADPQQAAATRRAKLADYAQAGTVMFCNHFPGRSAGRAVAYGEGYRFVPFDPDGRP